MVLLLQHPTHLLSFPPPCQRAPLPPKKHGLECCGLTLVLMTVFSTCSSSWSCCCITCCCSCTRPWLSNSAVASVSLARCCCAAVVPPANRASLWDSHQKEDGRGGGVPFSVDKLQTPDANCGRVCCWCCMSHGVASMANPPLLLLRLSLQHIHCFYCCQGAHLSPCWLRLINCCCCCCCLSQGSPLLLPKHVSPVALLAALN